MPQSKTIARRRFLKASALGAVGAGLAPRAALAQAATPAPFPSPELSRIKDYRTLGRTGFKVSDLGCGSIMDEGVLRAALDAGMNYIDTAEQYGTHHRIVGRAIKDRDRKSVFVTTKLQVLTDKPAENTKEGFLRRTRKALEEMRTPYVDCLMMHMPEKAADLKTEGFHAAMTELKAEGRVRFVGVSHHGSFWYLAPQESMESVLMAAAEDGRFDVFLMAYNFLRADGSETVLEEARKRKIGTALMKTTPVAIYEGMKAQVEAIEKSKKPVDPFYLEGLRRYKEIVDKAQTFIAEHNLRSRDEIRDAAIRFVLGNPAVGTVCCLVRTYADLEKWLKVSGTRLTAADATRLGRYGDGCGSLYCRHACGVCEPSCPRGVPVNTIMRYFQYFAGQGREREAMGYYAAIPGARAEACGSCAGPCEGACPHGVPVRGMLILADRLLTLP